MLCTDLLMLDGRCAYTCFIALLLCSQELLPDGCCAKTLHCLVLCVLLQEGHDVVLVQEYAEGGDLYRLLYKNGGR